HETQHTARRQVDDAGVLDRLVVPALAEASGCARLETEVRRPTRPGMRAAPPAPDLHERLVDLAGRRGRVQSMRDDEAGGRDLARGRGTRRREPDRGRQHEAEGAPHRHVPSSAPMRVYDNTV